MKNQMAQNKTIIKQFAPIVLFVYKRTWHTKQTLHALMANDFADQSTLYVYSDSPKHMASEEDINAVKDVRQLVKSEQWCKEVHLIEAEHNKGLVRSFVDGITEVVNRHGRVIVLEEDQITSKGFLTFLNQALDLYENDTRVMHVSGYMYPAKFECANTTFFLDVQTCPGWATWKRAWDLYNDDVDDHLRYYRVSKKRRWQFDVEGSAHFFAQLERNENGHQYSWAVRWYASCSCVGGLALFPSRSLVQNAGCDGTGDHCGTTSMYDVEPVDYLPIKRVPIKEDKAIRKSLHDYLKQNMNRPGKMPPLTKVLPHIRNYTILALRNLLRSILCKVLPEFNRVMHPSASGLRLPGCPNSTISPKACVLPSSFIAESTIDDYSYVSEAACISHTSIGKFCSIGPGVVCGWGIHPTDTISTAPMFYSTQAQNGTTLSGTNKVQERKPIRIGHDVLIGMNVTVLDGVTIGNGVIVGAGCVVSKDVEPYMIVVGNPMRVLRRRLPEDVIRRLEKIQWWDWPEEKLQEVEKNLFNVPEFVKQNTNNHQ